MVNYLNFITPVKCPSKQKFHRTGAQRKKRCILGLGEGFTGEVAFELSLRALMSH